MWYTVTFSIFILFLFFFFKIIFIFREGEGKGKEGEKHHCTRETLICCLLYIPQPVTKPATKHVSWPGMKLATFHSAERLPSESHQSGLSSFSLTQTTKHAGSVPLNSFHSSLILWPVVKKTLGYFPGWCSSVNWAQAWDPEGRSFNSRSGHMPGLWARSPVGGVWEATTHWYFSPSLSPSLPLTLKINKILKKKKNSRLFYSLTFTQEEIEALRSDFFQQMILLISGRLKIRVQACWVLALTLTSQ